MLTKNLIRYKIYKQTITPQFIQTDNTDLLNIATQLLELFNDSLHQTRQSLLSESKLITQNSKCNSIVTRGLEKLLLDRTTFNTDTQEELVNFRHELFSFTSGLHNDGKIKDLDSYYKAISNHFQKQMSEIQDQLYSDLPFNQPVLKFKSLSPERLLHRYNCAQVQGLLFHCEHLMLEIIDPDPAKLRQLFKYLRFYQLLAHITKNKDQSGFCIKIDGPLSLFFQTQKYGQNLSLFFPAILHQDKWRLTASIQFKNRKTALQLTLDHSCHILSHYQHFMAYIPDEIRQFQNSFQKKLSHWTIKPSESLIALPGETYCFPDYTLTNENDITIDLEIFHSWHSSPLIDRLKQLKQAKEAVLIIGVSNKILKDPTLANYIEQSDYFEKFGFLFRDMPTVNNVNTVLKRMENQ